MEKKMILVLLSGIFMFFVVLTVISGCGKEAYLDKEYFVKISNNLCPDQKDKDGFELENPFLCKISIMANVTNPKFNPETRSLSFDKLYYLNVSITGYCYAGYGNITILGHSFLFDFNNKESYTIIIRKLLNINDKGTIYLLPAEKKK